MTLKGQRLTQPIVPSVHLYPGHFLVGRHHDDHRGLRGHGAPHLHREDRGHGLLHMRRPRHRPAHPHHCQQLCRVLQEPAATGEGDEEEGSVGEGSATGEHVADSRDTIANPQQRNSLIWF